jgi:hypothetical protein
LGAGGDEYKFFNRFVNSDLDAVVLVLVLAVTSVAPAPLLAASSASLSEPEESPFMSISSIDAILM